MNVVAQLALLEDWLERNGRPSCTAWSAAHVDESRRDRGRIVITLSEEGAAPLRLELDHQPQIDVAGFGEVFVVEAEGLSDGHGLEEAITTALTARYRLFERCKGSDRRLDALDPTTGEVLRSVRVSSRWWPCLKPWTVLTEYNPVVG